jgi:hypothetical protein
VCLSLLVYPSLAKSEAPSRREIHEWLRQFVTHLSKLDTLLSFDFGRSLIDDFADGGNIKSDVQRNLVATRAAKAMYEGAPVRKARTTELSATLCFLRRLHFLLEKRQFELRRAGSGHAGTIKTGFTRGGYLAKFAAALWNCANEKQVRRNYFDYAIDVAREEHKLIERTRRQPKRP